MMENLSKITLLQKPLIETSSFYHWLIITQIKLCNHRNCIRSLNLR